MLKELLAGGGSFFGTSGGRPYKVSKEARLPVFGAEEKAGALEGEKIQASEELNFEKPRETRVRLAPERRMIQAEPEERRRLLDRRWRGGPRKLTQEEMRLEQVEVVRNDLRDADLELAPRRAARSSEGDLNPFAPRPIAAIGRPAHEKTSFGARVARWFRFLKRSKS